MIELMISVTYTGKAREGDTNIGRARNRGIYKGVIHLTYSQKETNFTM
jgi:hypothetical protein